MNLRENNFSFGGLHCMRDFGLIYAESGGHPITPPINRDVYEIAGLSGTVLMPGVTHGLHKFAGNLFFLQDPPDQAAAQENLRKIGAWLLNGRQRLIFDYEPHRYYVASVNEAARWDYAKWIEGGLGIEFEAQPYAYNVQENSASLTTAATSNRLTLVADTGVDAPLKVTILNTGAASITGATVTLGGRSAVFAGMSIAVGAALIIDMEPPIGAAFSNGANALPYATRYDYLTAQTGANAVGVALAFGSGTPGAKIAASTRGRYL
ncbi:MAG: hypothetical protein RSB86_18180 [Comamonas sp.]|uniref:hypothetical protein n=1 Tax=Comamonas sp. TaxID=34028 RepID=UPI002FC8567A